jgi:aminomethyltransferase
MKRTPLFDVHQQLGAKLIEFGGWEMPVYYSGIVAEHLAVRQAAGLFAISHMGEVFVRGPGAAAFLNYVLTNDVGAVAAGTGQYSLMCKPSGGVVDDLYVYCLAPEVVFVGGECRADSCGCGLSAGTMFATAGPAGRSGWRMLPSNGAIAVQGRRLAGLLRFDCEGARIGARLCPWPPKLKKNEVAGFRFRAMRCLCADGIHRRGRLRGGCTCGVAGAALDRVA